MSSLVVRSINSEVLDIKLTNPDLTIAELKSLVAEKKQVSVNHVVLMNHGRKLKDTETVANCKPPFIFFHIRKIVKSDVKKEVKIESVPISEPIPEPEPPKDIIQQRLESAGLVETKTAEKDMHIQQKVKDANVSYLILKAGMESASQYIIDSLIESKIDSSIPLILGTLFQYEEHKELAIRTVFTAHYDRVLKLFADKNIMLGCITEQDYVGLKYAIEELKFDPAILIDLYNRCNKDVGMTLSHMFQIMESNP